MVEPNENIFYSYRPILLRCNRLLTNSIYYLPYIYLIIRLPSKTLSTHFSAIGSRKIYSIRAFSYRFKLHLHGIKSVPGLFYKRQSSRARYLYNKTLHLPRSSMPFQNPTRNGHCEHVVAIDRGRTDWAM